MNFPEEIHSLGPDIIYRGEVFVTGIFVDHTDPVVLV